MPTHPDALDPAFFLLTEEARAGYLKAAMQVVANGGDPAVLETALADVERSRLVHPPKPTKSETPSE